LRKERTEITEKSRKLYSKVYHYWQAEDIKYNSYMLNISKEEEM
jgi:hypothetical protein